MYNIKILENAYISAIELAESCTPDSRSDCRDIYHIVNFVRASVRDFPKITDKTMVDTLGVHTARLKKIAGGKISENIIVSDNGEVFPQHITNPYGSLAHLIRRKLLKKDVKNYLRLYKIADLFMHRFLEYSDMLDDNFSIPKIEMKDRLLYALSLILEDFINLLEQAMKFEEIPYDEIIV